MSGACYLFRAADGIQSASVYSGEREVFGCSFDGAEAKLSFFYSVREEPLILRAAAIAGDEISFSVSDCHIAVYVNGRLADEEWPYGEALFGDLTEAKGNIRVEKTDIPEIPDGALPAVIRRFEGAAGIRIPGVNIGDCMPFSERGGKYHLFYLYDRHHHTSKWGLGAHQWAHASTEDFHTWEEHPMAVRITEPWEGSICTGSVMKAKDTYYAWYAERMSDRSPARLSCSISGDLYHFEKTGRYFSMPVAYEPSSARDPKVFEYGGCCHMFVTTTYLSTGEGCLAHLSSVDMESWRDEGPVFKIGVGDQPECPDWFKWGDYYYLIAGLRGVGSYFYSKSPFEGWISPENNAIPCGTVPKGAFLGDRLVFCGFVSEGGYAGALSATEAEQNPDGTLSFKAMKLR